MEITAEVPTYRGELIRLARRSIGLAQAEEAVAAVYVAFHHATKVPDLEGWLRMVTRRTVANMLRAESRRRKHEAVYAERHPEEYREADDGYLRYLPHLPAAIQQLEPGDQQVIQARLSGLHGSDATTRKRFQRAKARLRAILETTWSNLAL